MVLFLASCATDMLRSRFQLLADRFIEYDLLELFLECLSRLFSL